ncbi:hypothetical protein FX387_23910 [Salmonella enterica]|nr:hypothetical protein [Salmonella enterica]ECP0002189.1 hypothetical protein [Salmonella enterica]
MNLHGIVSGAVRRVNPYTDALVYRSRGSTLQADYSRVPEYDDPVPVRVQKQAVTQADLRHLDNLNQQGVFATLYTDGNWCGLNRTRQQGGDKFVIGDETWLVVEVPEIWPDWTRVIVCLQV